MLSLLQEKIWFFNKFFTPLKKKINLYIGFLFTHLFLFPIYIYVCVCARVCIKFLSLSVQKEKEIFEN